MPIFQEDINMGTQAKNSLVLSITVLVILLSGYAYGQAVYGSIFGRVTDPSGAALPNATVTITNTGTNVSVVAKTNESGNFNQTRLISGTYKIKVELQGFKTTLIDNAVVNVDTATESNAQLQTGQLSDEITISADVLTLKTDRADVSTTFETRAVNELPILDRNFTKLLLLTPGTQQLQWQHAASENPQGSTQIMVNGQHFSGTGYQLDGTENRDPILGIIVVNPNFEAIGETKITSQNYDAEFGQATAGVVSVSTKSGTNNFHGALFNFRQNDVWQARNPFTQSDPSKFPATLRNQFGGALGGRIITDKLFFFGDYQGTRSKIGGSKLLSVPTLKARAGDLSEYGIDIYDPTISNPLLRTKFSNRSIPQARLSQQALNLLKLVPLPNTTGTENGTRNNYLVSGSEAFDGDTFDVRIDGRLTEKFNTFGRYSFADYTRNGPTSFGAGGGPELVSLGGTSKVRNQSIAYGIDYTWSSKMVTDFRFGYFHYKVNVLPFDYQKKTASDAGIPGLNFDDFSSGLFAGFIRRGSGQGDLTNIGSGLGVNRCNCPLDQDEHQLQFVSNTTRFAGNHSIKFGVDIRRAYNLRVPSDTHRSGELTFASGRTAGQIIETVPGQAPKITTVGGHGLASFLLGDVTSFGRYMSTELDARERQWRHFYYAQDSWRVTDKLTFNYGVRFDFINPQTMNKPGAGGYLDLDTGEIIVAGVGSNGLNGNVENSVNPATRVSLAYRINDKLVVRAGYGRSYDIGVFGSLFGHSVTQNLPVLAIQNLNSASDFDRVFNLSAGAPAFNNFYGLNKTPKNGGTPNTSLPSNGKFFLPDGVSSFVLPEKQTLPTVDAYNVTAQYQLSSSIFLEAAYVGNKGTHVFAGDGPDFDINQAAVGDPKTDRNSRRPYFNKFGWTQGFRYFCNCADNRYDSLQAKLEKRFSKGYSFNVNYTLQRAIQEDGEQFAFDSSLNRGPAGWDRTHNFVFSQLLELPFGRGKRFLGGISQGADLLFGGWQFNSSTTISSGLPFNFGYDASTNIDTGPNRPNINGDPKIEKNGKQYTVDLSVFSNPGVGKFGNLKRHAYRGPGYWRTDASLFKRFKISESKEFEFRIESVNFFNHVNLGNPDMFLGSFNSAGKIVPTTNFGKIDSTAFGNSDPMRNFQFALKFKF